jgi:hypothetical protein
LLSGDLRTRNATTNKITPSADSPMKMVHGIGSALMVLTMAARIAEPTERNPAVNRALTIVLRTSPKMFFPSSRQKDIP